MIDFRSHKTTLISLAVLSVAVTSTLATEKKVGYNADVRPILSDKCFLCHGPDVENNKADLRLDTAEGAYAVLKKSSNKHAIKPGSPDESAAYQRIISRLPDEVMPPPESNLSLSKHEMEIIRKWIEQGAKYEKHWAFENLRAKIPVPEIDTLPWAKNEIDHFVSMRLKTEEIDPSPEADPVIWYRRASFASTGLPPSLEEIAKFKNDLKEKGEAAYETAVDALLAKPSFGEHFATPWLDAVRYADTWGYHADMDFTAWPYRDYVVQSYNEDKPYDQFLTENLAGDLMPNATRDQKLATASNRFNRMTNEGGSDNLEFFVDGVADRVNTFGTTYLGLTTECAKCHDHKYDPILAKDYYQLFAFFNSINEDGLYIHGNVSPPPSLLLPNENQEKKLTEIKNKIQSLDQEIAEVTDQSRPIFEEWRQSLTEENDFVFADQTGFFDFNQETEKPLVSRLPVNEDKKPPVVKIKGPKYVPGPEGSQTALALDGDNGAEIHQLFVKDRWDPFTLALSVKDTLRAKRSVVIAQRCHGTEVGYHGIDLRIEDGFLTARVFRAWPDNGIGIRSVSQLPKNEWHHLTVTYDGLSKASGLKMYLDGQPFETKVLNDKLYKSVNVKTYTQGHFTLGAIFRGPGFKGGQVDNLRTFDRPLHPAEVRKISGIEENFTDLDTEELFEIWITNHHQPYRDLIAKRREAHKALATHEDTFLEVPVMEEMPNARPAYLLHRGEFNAPRTQENRVERDSPGFLIPFPEDAPRNRLGLAQWLTDPAHPLTSRVYVNRIWQHLWGEGLVRTSENFGLQGSLPAYPDVLDWLSRDLIENGWSTKHLVRKVLLSATFRQSSQLTSTLREKDISNELLARGPSHRLSGEEIRDAALFTSGLLNTKRGGPPARPYDPVLSKKPRAADAHRRSVYSYWKRTKPQNNMIIFDKPSLEVCSVKRSRTNSPAQALVLLNDTQFVEAARVLASELIETDLDDPAKISTAWLKVTSREVSRNELRILMQILEEQRKIFGEQPEEAKKLTKVGLTPPPAETDTTELAALTITCQAIYNSDAAIWKR